MSSRADQLQASLDRTPFARFVGMKVDIEGDNLIARLPFQEMFIGNRAINALHGGATDRQQRAHQCGQQGPWQAQLTHDQRQPVQEFRQLVRIICRLHRPASFCPSVMASSCFYMVS